MSPAYNPIVRNFCRLRAVLVETLGVDRDAVCPCVPLADLIGPEQLPTVLVRLCEVGFRPGNLERKLTEWPLCGVMPVVLSFWLMAAVLWQSWQVLLGALPGVIAFGWAACTVTRTRTVSVPLGPRTVGEWVIYLTRFSDHPGYRFTRREIALKVRFIVAETLGIPVDRVTEESSFIEDFGAD